MAFPTAVNSQITDAVTQTNVKVVGDAPAMALSDAAHNATNNQQQTNVPLQASTTQAVSTLLAQDTAATEEVTHRPSPALD
jgi:hypothetical protein